MAVFTLLCLLCLLEGAHLIPNTALPHESLKVSFMNSTAGLQPHNLATLVSTGCSEAPCNPGFFKEAECSRCGRKLPPDILKCNGTNLFVMDCNCVTFDNLTHLTSVGGCIFNCGLDKDNELYFTERV